MDDWPGEDGSSRICNRPGRTKPIRANGAIIPALPASTCCVLSHTVPILTVMLPPLAAHPVRLFASA